jgi:hypothetical protein
MSQLAKAQSTTVSSQDLEAAGISRDGYEALAIQEAVQCGMSLDAAIAEYGGNPIPTSAIATQQPSAPAVVQKKRQRGGIAPVDLSVGKADASGDLAGAHKAGMDVGYTAVDPLMQQYENGVQAGVTKAVEDSRLRVQGFLGGALGRLDASFCDISGVDS